MSIYMCVCVCDYVVVFLYECVMCIQCDYIMCVVSLYVFIAFI